MRTQSDEVNIGRFALTPTNQAKNQNVGFQRALAGSSDDDLTASMRSKESLKEINRAKDVLRKNSGPDHNLAGGVRIGLSGSAVGSSLDKSPGLPMIDEG